MKFFRGVANALPLAVFLWAVIFIVAMTCLSGCKTAPVIGPCPPDRCVGPYDLTLTSHREALGL